MDSRNPLFITKRKTRVKCHTIIQQGAAGGHCAPPGALRRQAPVTTPLNSFEFYRFRFHFRALDPVAFPRREKRQRDPRRLRAAASRYRRCRRLRPPVRAPHCSRSRRFPAAWRTGLGRSSFAPRTWMASTIPPGGEFHFDVAHLRCRTPGPAAFSARPSQAVAEAGIGPAPRTRLPGANRATRPGRPRVQRGGPSAPALPDRPRSGHGASWTTRCLRFLTPTELKGGGDVASDRSSRFCSPGCGIA